MPPTASSTYGAYAMVRWQLQCSCMYYVDAEMYSYNSTKTAVAVTASSYGAALSVIAYSLR